MTCVEDICKTNDCEILITDENGVGIDTRLLHDGDTAIFTYTPRRCMTFVGWMDCDGNEIESEPFPDLGEYSYRLPIRCGCSVTALFTPTPVEVSTSRNIYEAGVESGDGMYACGDTVTVTATPNDGFVFVEWQYNGDTVSTNPEYTFTVNNDTALVAIYAEVEYNVVVETNNPAWGTATGSGTYPYGDNVAMVVTPSTSNYYFYGWDDNGRTDNPRNYYVRGNAYFLAILQPYAYTIRTVAQQETWGTTGGDGTYDYGTIVRLTAVANEGYHFEYWLDNDGNIISNDPYPNITVTDNATYVAVFAEDRYTITTIPIPSDGGFTTGDGVYSLNASCTIAAMPNASSGYEFVEWLDITDGTIPQKTFGVTGNRTLKALFKKKRVTYTVIVISDQPSCRVRMLKNGMDMGTVHEFDEGDIVTIVADTCPAYNFVQWDEQDSGTASTDSSYTFTVTKDTTFLAVHESAKCCVILTTYPEGVNIPLNIAIGNDIYAGADYLRKGSAIGDEIELVAPPTYMCYELVDIVEKPELIDEDDMDCDSEVYEDHYTKADLIE